MRDILGFGIAGNFAFHLEQAGEADDFKSVITKDENSPKGIFPFYVPEFSSYLGRYCFDDLNLILPNEPSLLVQAEPEIALRCELSYENQKVKSIKAVSFMAFNDASVRNDKTATKISQKKNFSAGSKGRGNEILIDEFSKNGICQNYSLVSFLKSTDGFLQYGECARLSEYSYFYDELLEWIRTSLNTQKDFLVLEDLGAILKFSGYKKQIIITIGATRYTKAGMARYLKKGDEISVVAFDHEIYSLDMVQKAMQSSNSSLKKASVLKQVVI